MTDRQLDTRPSTSPWLEPLGLALTVALIGVASAVGYFIAAAGAAGPMVFIGQSDATRNAQDAWMQIPIHAALATFVIIERLAPGRSIAGPVGISTAALLAVWGLTMTIYTIGSSNTDVTDVVLAGALLTIYLVILRLTWALIVRPVPA